MRRNRDGSLELIEGVECYCLLDGMRFVIVYCRRRGGVVEMESEREAERRERERERERERDRGRDGHSLSV